MKKKIRIGILGCGDFSAHFTELFKAHPYVEKVSCADTEIEKAKEFGDKFGIDYYNSLDELLETDINAVAIFTPRNYWGRACFCNFWNLTGVKRCNFRHVPIYIRPHLQKCNFQQKNQKIQHMYIQTAIYIHLLSP